MQTYKDLIDHCVDYLGADASKEAERFSRRAALIAYQEMANGHRWTYYFQRGRVVTVAMQTTGTVEYDHTGGTYERMVTLTGATWPSWAPYGNVTINNISYEIDELKTSTVITLKSTSNPGADVAALTAYTLYRDTYPLPSDFVASDEFVNVNNTGPLNYLHPREWLNSQRLHRGPATPRIYTFTGEQDTFGLLNVRFFPAPDQIYQFDYLYQRLPRPLVIDEILTGTATTTSGSTTVSGSGTAWTSRLVGSAIRFSADSLTTPTGRSGANPSFAERRITAVASTTSLTVDSALSDTLTGVKYSISDPIDIEDGAMSTFLLRESEKQMRVLRRSKANAEELKEYQDAMVKAWESDARNFGRRAAGMNLGYPQRLANMPRGADVS